MDRKKQIIRLINYTQSCLREVIDRVPEDQRNLPGQPDHWSVKDHIAHISHWKSVFNHRLLKREKQDKPVTDIDKENAKIFELYKNKSWDDVIKMLEAADEDLCRQVRLLSEEELSSTDILPGINTRSLWQALMSDGCTHPLSHISQLYIEEGLPEKALELQEKIIEDMQSLDDSHKWQGTNIYNLACAYALAGEAGRAIELLTEALKLNPDLKDWSTHDPDFNCIRDLTGYKELYANPYP